MRNLEVLEKGFTSGDSAQIIGDQMAMRSHGIAGTSARGRSSGSFGTGTSFHQDDLGLWRTNVVHVWRMWQCGGLEYFYKSFTRQP